MAIKIFSSIVLLALVVNTFAIDVQPMVDQQKNTMKILLKAFGERNSIDAAAAKDPNVCFAYYLDEQDQIGVTYSKEYIVCVDDADAAKKLLTDESAEVREGLISRGESICSDLAICEENSDAYKFFTCYGKTASNDTQPLYSIATDSDAQARSLKVRYEKIENDLDECVVVAYNEYIDGLAGCNKHLQDCLVNDVYPIVPTTTMNAPTMDDAIEAVSEANSFVSSIKHGLRKVIKQHRPEPIV